MNAGESDIKRYLRTIDKALKAKDKHLARGAYANAKETWNSFSGDWDMATSDKVAGDIDRAYAKIKKMNESKASKFNQDMRDAPYKNGKAGLRSMVKDLDTRNKTHQKKLNNPTRVTFKGKIPDDVYTDLAATFLSRVPNEIGATPLPKKLNRWLDKNLSSDVYAVNVFKGNPMEIRYHKDNRWVIT